MDVVGREEDEVPVAAFGAALVLSGDTAIPGLLSLVRKNAGYFAIAAALSIRKEVPCGGSASGSLGRTGTKILVVLVVADLRPKAPEASISCNISMMSAFPDSSTKTKGWRRS